MVTTSPPVGCWPVRRSSPGFCLAGPDTEKRTASMLGPVRSGSPAAGQNGGLVRDRTGPDRVHPDLCPPVGLKKLVINDYKGSRYPEWMVVEQRDGPNELQELEFHNCSQLGPGPELGAFPGLRELHIYHCNWCTLPCNMEQLTSLEILEIEGCINIQLLPTLPKSLRVLKLEYCSCDALPGNIEHLTSLKELEICECKNILSLPTLPQSLLKFELSYCDDELMKGCQTEGDPNWFKIKNIPEKIFESLDSSSTSSEDVASHASEEFQA